MPISLFSSTCPLQSHSNEYPYESFLLDAEDIKYALKHLYFSLYMVAGGARQGTDHYDVPQVSAHGYGVVRIHN